MKIITVPPNESKLLRSMLTACLGLSFCLFISTFVSANQLTPSKTLESLSEEERQWLIDHPVIKVGIDPEFGPYSFVNNNGETKGIAIDFLSLMSQQLGIRFEMISSLSWRELIDAIKNKQIDIIPTVNYLPEREDFLSFTSNYLATPLVVMTRKDSAQLHTLSELQNLRVALVQGYATSKKLLKKFPDLHPFYTSNPKEGLTALALGSADAYIGVLGVNEFIAQHNGISGLKINAAFDMENHSQAIGVRKDWPMLASILNKSLNTITIEQRNKIFDQWLPIQIGNLPQLESPSWTTRFFPWLSALFFIALTGYILSLNWNRRLQTRLTRRIDQISTQNQEIDRLNSLINAMIDASTDAIFVKDTEGRYLLSNKALANFLDKTLEQVIGSRDEDLFPADIAQEIYRDDKNIMQSGETKTYEESFVRADGEIIPFLSTKGPVHVNGELIGVFGISRDISEIKLAMDLLQNSLDEMEQKVIDRTQELALTNSELVEVNKKLETVNKELEKVNKELETFTYSVSHDLKAPLRGLDGYSRLLLQDHSKDLNEEGKLFLNNLRESAETMGQLIDDLLAYSRLERRHLQHHSLQLNSVYERIKHEFKASLDKVELHENIESIIINTDPLALTLILRNLLGNAIKFSAHSHPSVIHVTAKSEKNRVKITIQDNGIGFDMQFHDRIFDIFQRLQRSEDYPGTGIGLAISLKAAQRLGGRLHAKSEMGKGATFYLDFPQ